MADRALYLHEYVDIVGEGAMQYMEHTARFDPASAADRGLELLGTFYVMGSTGRWPQVVNLWECVDGRAGWRRLMERTNLQRTRNPALNEWWKMALEVRSGGFDRLLGAAPGCPTIESLRRDGVTGSVLVHELSRCRPGAALDYLAAVREEWVPVMSEHGHRLVGLYEVLMADTEVVTVWAGDPAGQESLGRAIDDGDERIVAWRRRARDYLTGWREELMTPAPGTLLSRGDTL
ncbi:MAG TPA: hypothetical protein VIC35_05950 [Acidimicrobiia bacterium]|jgi:hypothetical protein